MRLIEHLLLGFPLFDSGSVSRLAKRDVSSPSSVRLTTHTAIGSSKLCDRYNSSGDADLLNPFLSYRTHSRKDQKSSEAYEALVRFVYDRLDIRTTQSSHEKDSQNSENYNYSELSERYTASAYIAELLQNRQDLLEKVLKYKNGLKIRLVGKIIAKKDCGGYYDPEEHRIIIENGGYQIFDSKRDSHNIVIHELGHALDYIDGNGDGIPDGMTEEQVTLFQKNRDELFEKYHNYRQGLSPDKLEEINKQHYDPATRLTNYAFQDKQEFLADTLAMFYDNPSHLKEACPALYNVYVDYLKIDPLKDLEIDKFKIKEAQKKKSFVKRVLITVASLFALAFLGCLFI